MFPAVPARAPRPGLANPIVSQCVGKQPDTSRQARPRGYVMTSTVRVPDVIHGGDKGERMRLVSPGVN